MASPSCRGPHWPCCCSADTLRRPVARVAGFPKACGLRPSRTLSAFEAAAAHLPRWLFLITLTRPCPKQPPKRPHPPRPPACCSPVAAPARPTRWGCWRRLPTCARPVAQVASPTRFPSSPAPRRAPSTPPRWPAGPTTLTAPCGALPGCGGNSMPTRCTGADSLSVMRSGARWLTLVSIGWALARWRRMRPQSLLDNKPLEKLLVKMVPSGASAPPHPQGPPQGAGRHGVQLQLGQACHLL